jgi:molybdopterin/thiamine biosynthesis adenylyltransferase
VEVDCIATFPQDVVFLPTELPMAGPPAADVDRWSYELAFSRNLGLINPGEQERLRASRVAIAGMGGVGGVHLATLARLGIGAFRIADPDTFDIVNTNRQYGADIHTLGRSKVQVMAEKARAINPELKLEVFSEPVHSENLGSFLDGVDLLLDGIDFFSFDTRRRLFREAARRGIWAITAGPIGFSAAWLVFDPAGMSFDDYFDLHDGMAPAEEFAAFAMGLAPRGTQFPYIDLSYVDFRTGRGPSVGFACNLCSAVAAAEAVKILLGRKPLRPVPCYAQFDAYRCILRQGRLVWGNRGPVQRLKRRVLRHRMIQLGYEKQPPADPVKAPYSTLLAAAVQAPSGDNTQPWRFDVDTGARQIAIYLDETRDPSPMNSGQRMARLAIGAALENLLRAAEDLGLKTELLPPRGEALAVVRVDGIPGTGGEIRPEIAARATNRRPYDGRPIDPGVLAELQHQTPDLSGVRTLWIGDRDRIASLARLIGRADALMLSEPSMRRAFLDNLRFDLPANAVAEEGLSLGSLEVTAADRLALRIMRWIPHWLLMAGGAARKFSANAERLVQSSSGLCFVVEEGGTPDAEIRAGRAMRRAWLAATEKGLAVQPMMSLAILESVLRRGSQELLAVLGRQQAAELVGELHALVPEIGTADTAFIMRLGYAPPPTVRTGRRTPAVKSPRGC